MNYGFDLRMIAGDLHVPAENHDELAGAIRDLNLSPHDVYEDTLPLIAYAFFSSRAAFVSLTDPASGESQSVGLIESRALAVLQP